MRTDVIVIGGGLAGLACALALVEHDLDVIVVESTERLGGRAHSVRDEETGDVVDIGPHILLSDYTNMLRFMSQLGTRDHVCWQRDPFITLLDGRHARDMRARALPAPLPFLPSLIAAPSISLRDLFSNRTVLWRTLRLDHARMLEYDRRTAEDVLRDMGSSRQFTDWFWRSTSMTIMNSPLEHCSAGSLLNFARFLLGRNRVQVGFPNVALGDLFAPQAERRLVDRARLLRRSVVREIILGESGATGVRLDEGATIHARWCVSAIPPAELLAIAQANCRHVAPFDRLHAFHPSPYVTTYLWFDRKITDAKFWSRVWSPDSANFDSYDLSNIRTGWSDRHSIIASNMIDSERLPAMTDDEIIATTVREIAEFAPEAARARVLHARVHRIPMAIPRPEPGFEGLRPGPQTQIPGLVLAGDWTRTGLPCSMEGAVRSGWLAAEHVLAAAGRPQALAAPLPHLQGFARWFAREHRWQAVEKDRPR